MAGYRRRHRFKRDDDQREGASSVRVLAGLLLLLLLLVWWGAGDWGWIEPVAVIPGTVWLTLGLILLLLSVTYARDGLATLLSLPIVLTGAFWLGVVNAAETPPAEGRAIRVITWNVTHLANDQEERLEFFRFLSRYRPDLVLLQEARLDEPAAFQQALEPLWPNVRVVNQGEYTLISTFPILEHDVPDSGGFMHARVQIGERVVDVYDVHLFTVLATFERRLPQYRNLLDGVQGEELVLVGGDFNVPWHHPWLRELRDRLNVSNPQEWSVPLTLPSALPVARVDYVFASDALTFDGYEHLKYRPSWQGHLGVLTELRLPGE